MTILRRLPMFAGLPQLRWKPGPPENIVSAEKQAHYPALRDDFALADAAILASFQTLNANALKAQNTHRREQMLLIIGASLATILGATQASVTSARWPGFAEMLVAGASAAIAFRSREGGAHDQYLTCRLRAERLRSEYFEFVGHAGAYSAHAGPYAATPQAVVLLRERTATIEHGEEPR